MLLSGVFLSNVAQWNPHLGPTSSFLLDSEWVILPKLGIVEASECWIRSENVFLQIVQTRHCSKLKGEIFQAIVVFKTKSPSTVETGFNQILLNSFPVGFHSKCQFQKVGFGRRQILLSLPRQRGCQCHFGREQNPQFGLETWVEWVNSSFLCLAAYYSISVIFANTERSFLAQAYSYDRQWDGYEEETAATIELIKYVLIVILTKYLISIKIPL